mgnify:CR=1 FL=1
MLLQVRQHNRAVFFMLNRTCGEACVSLVRLCCPFIIARLFWLCSPFLFRVMCKPPEADEVSCAQAFVASATFAANWLPTSRKASLVRTAGISMETASHAVMICLMCFKFANNFVYAKIGLPWPNFTDPAALFFNNCSHAMMRGRPMEVDMRPSSKICICICTWASLFITAHLSMTS